MMPLPCVWQLGLLVRVCVCGDMGCINSGATFSLEPRLHQGMYDRCFSTCIMYVLLTFLSS